MKSNNTAICALLRPSLAHLGSAWEARSACQMASARQKTTTSLGVGETPIHGRGWPGAGPSRGDGGRRDRLIASRQGKFADRNGAPATSLHSGRKYFGPPKIWGCRKLIGPLSIEDGRQAFGAHVISKPPDDKISAILGLTVADERKCELVRNFASKSIQPDAAVRHVGHEAIVRAPPLAGRSFARHSSGDRGDWRRSSRFGEVMRGLSLR